VAPVRLVGGAVGAAVTRDVDYALGVPTFDGLGAVGDGAHASEGACAWRPFPRRVALPTHLLLAL